MWLDLELWALLFQPQYTEVIPYHMVIRSSGNLTLHDSHFNRQLRLPPICRRRILRNWRTSHFVAISLPREGCLQSLKNHHCLFWIHMGGDLRPEHFNHVWDKGR
jgi:hypothetical protein